MRCQAHIHAGDPAGSSAIVECDLEDGHPDGPTDHVGWLRVRWTPQQTHEHGADGGIVAATDVPLVAKP